MDATHIYGSLVIAATTPCRQFPQLEGSKAQHGNHTDSRTRGLFSTLTTGGRFTASDVALPQRNKYMAVTTASRTVEESAIAHTRITKGIVDLDSRFDGSRQLYKLNQLMSEAFHAPGVSLPAYVSIINNISEHAHFSLLSEGIRLYLCGIYDTVNSSVRLVWSTDSSFIDGVRCADPMRYVFYRFPTLLDRPLFINTQPVCANWYKWNKAFTGIDGLARAFNALELFLYKDPTVNSYES